MNSQTVGRAISEDLINVAPRAIRKHPNVTPSTLPIAQRTGRKTDVATHRTRCFESPLFETAGLNGKLATHSLRKSFAQRLYDQTGDIFTVQEMLGHKSVVTTQKYLGVNYASVRDALQKMSLDAELHEIGILGGSLKKEADATLFLELALRGYDLSKLRDSANETTAKIIKIG